MCRVVIHRPPPARPLQRRQRARRRAERELDVALLQERLPQVRTVAPDELLVHRDGARDRRTRLGEPRLIGQHAREVLLANLDRLRIPVLVLGGGVSGFGPTFVQGAAAAFSAARPRIVTIPGAGHLPWFDKPAETLGALRAFFDDCAPRSASR